MAAGVRGGESSVFLSGQEGRRRCDIEGLLWNVFIALHISLHTKMAKTLGRLVFANQFEALVTPSGPG